mmetsp:Transcript_2234/g.5993  ORF Transcript_2234/g.5993 Transcript_2234/m.5993 type:complete len:303 (-) Transcript_2234:157-1065(-)
MFDHERDHEAGQFQNRHRVLGVDVPAEGHVVDAKDAVSDPELGSAKGRSPQDGFDDEFVLVSGPEDQSRGVALVLFGSFRDDAAGAVLGEGIRLLDRDGRRVFVLLLAVVVVVVVFVTDIVVVFDSVSFDFEAPVLVVLYGSHVVRVDFRMVVVLGWVLFLLGIFRLERSPFLGRLANRNRDALALVHDGEEDVRTFPFAQTLLVDAQNHVSDFELRVAKESVLGNVGHAHRAGGILFQLDPGLGVGVFFSDRDADESAAIVAASAVAAPLRDSGGGGTLFEFAGLVGRITDLGNHCVRYGS